MSYRLQGPVSHLGLQTQFRPDFINEHRGILLFGFVTILLLAVHFLSR